MRRCLQYIPDNQDTRLEEGETVMTWTSDSTGVLLYAVLSAFLMLSSIYVPA